MHCCRAGTASRPIIYPAGGGFAPTGRSGWALAGRLYPPPDTKPRRVRCAANLREVAKPPWSAVRHRLWRKGSAIMKIHALCLVKNEADVLQETLLSALHWCDHIYVFDNGSNDGTWELVKKLAKQHLQIVPYKQDSVIFGDSLRAEIFNAFRSNAGSQDWWCRLDADEFYIDDPRVFLAKIPHRFQTVYSAVFNYYFTDQDLNLYQQNPAEYLQIPVQQRLRYYLNNHGEPRFFRHNDDLVWTRSQTYGGYPPEVLFEGPAYPVRIWLKHYQYRSPEQIERRLFTRRPAIEARGMFPHEARSNWRAVIAAEGRTRSRFEPAEKTGAELIRPRWEERIALAATLDYDAFDRRYIVNEELMPEFPVRRPRSFLRKAIPQPIRATLGPVRRRALLLLERLLDRAW
jgi:glycosyltransferase involved in cell wall biosynthesis